MYQVKVINSTHEDPLEDQINVFLSTPIIQTPLYGNKFEKFPTEVSVTPLGEYSVIITYKP